MASLKSRSSITGISAEGNTPLIKLSSKGASSDINFGTTVSQNDLRIIFYSSMGRLAFSLSILMAFRLRAPAEFSTDFKARSPKS